jgi:hypothetical protein
MVLEFILVFPFVLLAVIAVVEFGLMFGNAKHVPAASRTGAKLAAQSGTLDAATVAAIKTEVDRQLVSAGFVFGSTEVVLQHNVGSATTVVISSLGGSGSGNFQMLPALPDSTVVPKGCVRVTVNVSTAAYTPDLLSAFGISVQDQDTSASTTFAYEAH